MTRNKLLKSAAVLLETMLDDINPSKRPSINSVLRQVAKLI